MEKKPNIIDVSRIRKSFSDIRTMIDELQKIVFTSEQIFIREYCELERQYRAILDELSNQNNDEKI